MPSTALTVLMHWPTYSISADHYSHLSKMYRERYWTFSRFEHTTLLWRNNLGWPFIHAILCPSYNTTNKCFRWGHSSWTDLWVFFQLIENIIGHKGWVMGPGLWILWGHQCQHYLSWSTSFGFTDWNSSIYLILCEWESSWMGCKIRHPITVC